MRYIDPLGIAKAGVELEQARADGGLHESAVENAAVGEVLRSKGADRLLEAFDGPVPVRRAQERKDVVALEDEPIPPVLGPRSPSRARLKSWTAGIGWTPESVTNAIRLNSSPSSFSSRRTRSPCTRRAFA